MRARANAWASGGCRRGSRKPYESTLGLRDEQIDELPFRRKGLLGAWGFRDAFLKLQAATDWEVSRGTRNGEKGRISAGDERGGE